jgi:hypothetical protein
MAVKVKNQLQQLLKNDSWQLFSFEEPSGAGNSSSKLVTFSSRQEFEHAVREKHLVSAVSGLSITAAPMQQLVSLWLLQDW